MIGKLILFWSVSVQETTILRNVFISVCHLLQIKTLTHFITTGLRKNSRIYR